MSEVKTIFNQNKKKKQVVKDDSKVIITIRRELAGVLPKTIAKFTATQKKDRNFNLVLINDKHNFKEDIEIVKDKVLEQLLYRLNIMGDLPKEKRPTPGGEVGRLRSRARHREGSRCLRRVVG